MDPNHGIIKGLHCNLYDFIYFIVITFFSLLKFIFTYTFISDIHASMFCDILGPTTPFVSDIHVPMIWDIIEMYYYALSPLGTHTLRLVDIFLP